MNWAKGCIVYPIALIAIWKIGGCVVGEIIDGAQEVIAKRHAKQQIADEKARAKLKAKAAAEAAEAARVAEELRAAAEKEAAHKRLEDEKRRAEAEANAKAAREAEKFDKLRTFALKEAPAIWNAYQQLEAAIVVQDERIRDLAIALKEFGRDPVSDPDYRALGIMRNEMSKALEDIRQKLEDAYLASCRYKATPSHEEYSALMRKAIEDGTHAAEAASRKFSQMKIEK